MRNYIFILVLAGLSGFASLVAHASVSATLSVNGKITPGPCSVSLSSDAVSLGTIPASALTQDYYQIAGNTVSVNVLCTAATAVVLQAMDNRSASAMTVDEVFSDMGLALSRTDDNLFGLGRDSQSHKVGALMFDLFSGTLNGVIDNNLLTSQDNAAWTASAISYVAPYALAKNAYFALAVDSASTSPAPVTIASYSFKPIVTLKKASKYPAGQSVAIDGSTTFSVVYL